MEVRLEVSAGELKGSVLVTGFRGFGMVGYLVSKHLASAFDTRRVGYVITDYMPSFILVEDGGVGYPFDIYHSKSNRLTVLVNRAVPEKPVQDDYARGIAEWAASVGFKYIVLVGGLAREHMPEEEKHGYRWVHNRFYNGPKLEAPLMEPGLGVVGPLSLLYIYFDYYEVPALMVLPYTIVEGVDYDSILLGVRVIAEKLLGLKPDVQHLEDLARLQRMEIENIYRMMREERGEAGEMFM